MHRSVSSLILTVMLYLLPSLLFMGSLTGCTGDSEEQELVQTDSGPSDVDGIAEHETVQVLEAPLVSFTFSVDKSATTLHLVSSAAGRQLRLVKLLGPDNRAIYSRVDLSDQKYSQAGEFQNSPNSFNFPFGESAGALKKGEYRATYELSALNNSPVSEADLAGTTLRAFTKNDPDGGTGVVNVTLFYGDVVANSKELRDGVENVFNLTRETLQRAGISVHVEQVDLPELPELLPNPVTGDVLYREMARESARGINIYFATDAAGTGTRLNSSVLAGSSPMPFSASNRSAVVVSIARATGNDGRFDGEDFQQGDDSEYDILADNLSHEIFHALGLQNSVDFSGANVVSTDGLDSEKCTTENSCQENRGASENVMFPYALKKVDVVGDQFFPRYRVSVEQARFANRFILVD